MFHSYVSKKMGQGHSRKTIVKEVDSLRTQADIVNSIDQLVIESNLVPIFPDEIQNNIKLYADQAKLQLQRSENAKQLTKTDYVRIYSLLLRAFKPHERRDCEYLNQMFTVQELTQEIRKLIYDPCIVPIVASDFVPLLESSRNNDIFDF